jgi:hypothetical protein
MSKCLTVVALALLVLTGAMGLRSIVAGNASTLSATSLSAPAIWSNGGGPIPPLKGGGGGIWANGGGPIPPRNGGGPIPPRSVAGSSSLPNGGGPIPPRNGGGPIPPLKGGGGGSY